MLLLGIAGRAEAVVFSIDASSASANFILSPVSAADLLGPGPSGGPPAVLLLASALGLGTGDDIDALSIGGLPPSATGSVPVFSPDGSSSGAAGTALAAEAALGQAAGDLYQSPIPGGNLLLANQADLGLQPPLAPGTGPTLAVDNLDAVDTDGEIQLAAGAPIYFSLAAGSPTLTSSSLSPADILVSDGSGAFSVAMTAVCLSDPSISCLGLDVADDVDALFLDAGLGQAWFSLARGSVSLGTTYSPADVFAVSIGNPPTLLGGQGPNYPPATLGLVSDDNVDALDFLPLPEPGTALLAGFGLALLGGLRRRAA